MINPPAKWLRILVATWSILTKDIRTYYLKPPNISWGIIFPLAWTGMFLVRSGLGLESIAGLLPGVVGVSVLFGTTSILAVTITFEKRGRSFERLLLAPIPLEMLLLAKTCGAVLFGMANAFVPVIMTLAIGRLPAMHWPVFVVAVVLIATSSAFLALLIAVCVREVFEAQALSNFFRFPMLFLCGLFFPIERLPHFLRPFSYLLPLTYGADLLKFCSGEQHRLPVMVNTVLLALFCVVMFVSSLAIVRRKWIV